MIYKVELDVPAFNEVDMVTADSPEEAIVRMAYDTMRRMLRAGAATARVSAADQPLPGQTYAPSLEQPSKAG
jgi:hypothetical protein